MTVNCRAGEGAKGGLVPPRRRTSRSISSSRAVEIETADIRGSDWIMAGPRAANLGFGHIALSLKVDVVESETRAGRRDL